MRLKLLILTIIPILSFGQANLYYVRTIDSTFSILNQNSPSDTLWKFTSNGYLIKYQGNAPSDTMTVKGSKIDSSRVADTALFALNGGGGGGLMDSVYVSDQGIWTQDTIPKSDSTRDEFKIGLNELHRIFDSGGTLFIQDSSGNYISINNSSFFTEISKDGFSGLISMDQLGKQAVYGFSYDNGIAQFRANNSGVEPYIWLRVVEDGQTNDLKIYHDSIRDTSMVAEFKQIVTEKVITDTINLNGVDYTDLSIAEPDKLVNATDTIQLVGDTLFAENQTSKFKNIFASVSGFLEKLVTNLIVLNGDSATGFIELKDAIEAESLSEINFDTATKAYTSGKLFFQGKTQSLSFYNDISGFTHNLGYENVRRVHNSTGLTIPSGRLVRRVGNYVNGDIIAAVALAGCSTEDSARVYGMTTVEIAPDGVGIVTISGDVRGENWVGLNETSGYLGYNGELIDSCPIAPCLCTYVGEIVYSDNDSGQVDISIERPVYNPRPILTAQFTEQTINVTNAGVGVYSLITNATSDLYTIKDSVGFSSTADSFLVNVAGAYDLDLAYSLYNSATQTDDYRLGIFINGALEFSMLRSVSNVSKGVNSFPQTLQLSSGDWISIKITNLTIATRNAVFNDGILKMIYLGD